MHTYMSGAEAAVPGCSRGAKKRTIILIYYITCIH